MSLDRTGVMEIGLKSEGDIGEEIFLIGIMHEDFHCEGTIDCDNDLFRMKVNGSVNTGADSLKNQDGKPSRPVAVGLRLSSRVKTLNSEIGSSLEIESICFMLGWIYCGSWEILA